ncbi:hypothetical protein BRW84_10390 [Oxalobacter formigenes OXCC13]|uniref:Phage holin family protein n=1 Tax=Oxalobacter formigenes OXCC13 TaxID=556269 RepID=C3X781_OXAFO|nr:hypothetical protein BRW83_2196 [Oxalobacter formigenes]ARQ78975.1 hypothetical protein BRW84_10390 [Oxalobacter formigenes OXCC13]EEO29057.1 hypothetical protein OFBG_00085 [Oxalobacter formigenes OXCC13]QDX32436.1 phage holin family protein [Oxalobacter formigenes]
MFNSLRRIKQFGKFMQERSGDYARLFFLEIEIQKQLFFNRLICIIIFSLSVFLSVIFLGIALIVSFWDTPYRILVAWLVFTMFILIMIICAFIYSHNRINKPMFYEMKAELKNDLSLMKDML